MARKKIVLIVCAIFLGSLVAMLPCFLYPVFELKKDYPYGAQVPQPEYKEFQALREYYSLGNNLIQVLMTIISATVLGFVFWLYSKRII